MQIDLSLLRLSRIVNEGSRFFFDVRRLVSSLEDSIEVKADIALSIAEDGILGHRNIERDLAII